MSDIILDNGRLVLKRRIDEKHHIEFGILVGDNWSNAKLEIIKTTNGQPIPETEPVILFRARDYLAVPMLIHYRTLCASDGATDYQLASMDKMISEFKKFAVDNPTVMKQPGCTLGK